MTEKTIDEIERKKNHCRECGIPLNVNSDERTTGLCTEHLKKFRAGVILECEK